MKQLIHHQEKCLKCAGCVGICPRMALDMYGLDLKINQEKCVQCGLCVRACPSHALEIKAENE